MSKPKVLILGKLPPPFMGPAIATEIILKSSLGNSFELIHLDTRINSSISTMGKFSFGKLWLNLKMYFRMFFLLLRFRPSLVLIPISQSKGGYLKDSVFIFMAAVTGRKILLHLRGSAFRDLYESSSGFFRSLIRRTLKMSDGVIVLGQNLRKLFSGLMPEEKIFVVPNGGNYDLPQKVQGGEEIRLLYLSNLMKEKGITDVLQAAALLKKSGIRFSLSIAGDWLNAETHDESVKLIGENDLPVTIYPPQNRESKFRRMAEADIFLFPPRSPEGHPWVLVESMASSLPVIATDMGAIVESVVDGVNGYIVNPGKPAEIFEKLTYLIRNPQIRQEMSRNSRRLYEEKFTEDRMVQNLASVFNKILQK